MVRKANDRRSHFFLAQTSEPKPFTAHSNGGGDEPLIPAQIRQSHGADLQRQLSVLQQAAVALKLQQQREMVESGLGLQVQFVGMPNVELAFESLANETQKIELLSVRKDGTSTIANVFIPDGKLPHFEKYLTEYLQEKKNRNGGSLDHRELIDAISSIRAAEVRALWTDEVSLLPQDRDEAFMWEVWLPVRGKNGELRDAVVGDFRRFASASGCVVSEKRVDFPERTIVHMFGSTTQLSQSVLALNLVAELRRAKETAEFFSGMKFVEQVEWAGDLTARLQAVTSEKISYVCVIDSGVSRGHPLLSELISADDVHTVDPAWGTDDSANHGTGLAGLALYGDLSDSLAHSAPVRIEHRVESVKIISAQGTNTGSNDFHADLFAQAVSYPEIAFPDRNRVFSSAVTSDDYRDRGRPSSWSATLDRLASDADGNGSFPRLIIQAAGNLVDQVAWTTYPAHISTNLIHDPGQAWNVITVGAYTRKTHITETDASAYVPLAPDGGLSPMSSSSATWDRAWPLKPDVVFEGGNAASDPFGAVTMDSLMLLTTNNVPHERVFTTTNATSAASALCARMAAQIQAAYPLLRPETVRALIVHSARWTEAMRKQYLPAQGPIAKASFGSLIRHCGWGAPDLESALWSAGNSLTLLVEDKVHPYKKEKSNIKTRDMNLHSLPWPKEALEALGQAPVRMRVTLSYFVEPNPSARGVTSKYHYPSHRLRFDVRHALETTDDFVARVSAAAAQEDSGEKVSPKDPDWILGSNQRNRGSIHQDVWSGTAADLANRGCLAVYPGPGWWRSRPKLERYNRPAFYSLIVSIETDEVETDLYTEITNMLAVPIEVEV
jgi:hypothetical protein